MSFANQILAPKKTTSSSGGHNRDKSEMAHLKKKSDYQTYQITQQTHLHVLDNPILHCIVSSIFPQSNKKRTSTKKDESLDKNMIIDNVKNICIN